MSEPAAPCGVLDGAELVGFALALAGRPERWRHLVTTDGEERDYETIWSDSFVNAWVICWPDDSDTGFHDHDDSAAGIVVVEGDVIEERLALSGPPLARRFAAGQAFHIPPVAIHRVRHGGGTPALTVHAYSPPLRRQGVYRSGPNGVLEREGTPHTVALSAERGGLRV